MGRVEIGDVCWDMMCIEGSFLVDGDVVLDINLQQNPVLQGGNSRSIC